MYDGALAGNGCDDDDVDVDVDVDDVDVDDVDVDDDNVDDTSLRFHCTSRLSQAFKVVVSQASSHRI